MPFPTPTTRPHAGAAPDDSGRIAVEAEAILDFMAARFGAGARSVRADETMPDGVHLGKKLTGVYSALRSADDAASVVGLSAASADALFAMGESYDRGWSDFSAIDLTRRHGTLWDICENRLGSLTY